MDEAWRELVRAWFWKAASDLASAQMLARSPEATGDAAIYHCQQAVKKAVKGLLVYHGVMPPKTHDLAGLMAIALPFEPRLAAWRVTGARLTEYVTDYRYPDEVGFLVPEEGELRQALQDAQAIVGSVLEGIPPEFRSTHPGAGLA